MKKKLSCMSIVVVTDDKSSSVTKVLIMENNGEFVFPKGHVELGETNLNAAIREVYEETGVKVTASDHIGIIDQFEFYFDGEKAIKVIEVHLFHIQETQPTTPNTNEGIVSVTWMSVPQAFKEISHNDARNAFQKAIDRLNG